MPTTRLLTLFATSDQRPAPLRLTSKETARLTPRQQARYLLDELRDKRVLVPLSGKRTSYFVPHRSILEYFTACALAAQLNHGPEAVWELVDKKAWHPDWEQVIIFLAGKLASRDGAADSPLDRLLTLLADDRKDDVFRHRLALGAMCLPEIPSERRGRYSDLTDRITTDAFSLWWDSESNLTTAAVLHLARTLPALGEVNGRLAGTPLLKWLLEQLSCEAPDLRRRALEAIESIGPLAARPDIRDRLTQMLRDEDWGVSHKAAEAVGALGAPGPRFLDQIARLLRDQNPWVREAACSAVRCMGRPAAKPAVLDRLAEMLRDLPPRIPLFWHESRPVDPTARFFAELFHDQDPIQGVQTAWEKIRVAALDAVAAIGAPAARPDILDEVEKLLSAEWEMVRWAASRAFRTIGTPTSEFLDRIVTLIHDGHVYSAAPYMAEAIGPAAASAEFLDRLAELLGHDSARVRGAAALVVRAIGAPAARSDILDRLAQLLRDKNGGVPWVAAEAIEAIGAPAARPDILGRLAQLLRHEDRHMRSSAAKAIGGIGAAAAKPDIPGSLAQLLRHGDWHVQSAAAEAVGRMGAPAARPDILGRLAQLLRHEDRHMRSSAAKAIGGIGAPAATPDILDRLAELLRHDDGEVRQQAARAVGSMGAAAARPDILDRLAELLSHDSARVRGTAAHVVRAIGAPAARPDILDRLAELLGHDSARVGGAAARAIGTIMAEGIRIFKGPRGQREARTVADLSR